LLAPDPSIINSIESVELAAISSKRIFRCSDSDRTDQSFRNAHASIL